MFSFQQKESLTKDGMFKKSLQQENYKNALKLAHKEWLDFWKRTENKMKMRR